jgi:hypothetical protein
MFHFSLGKTVIQSVHGVTKLFVNPQFSEAKKFRKRYGYLFSFINF